jgi:S-adenosylmethionine:tRNA ribosyltransferase-isomerase
VNLPFIHINDFDYPLPDERIARYPLEKRSASKLLVYKTGKIEHHQFSELPDLLPENTLLIFNNTKVIQARLHFRKETGAEVEVFLLNPVNRENAGEVLGRKESSAWHCLVGNKKRFKEGDILQKDDLSALWLDRENDVIQFNYGDKCFADVIEESGNLPIPPYLNRPTENIDKTRYQTTFAINKGSVAAPTAALHFDAEINQHLVEKGIHSTFLTLHVGAGTFKPVSTENALEHTMHEEYIVFSKELIRKLKDHSQTKIAVGTTSLRSLESLYGWKKTS